MNLSDAIDVFIGMREVAEGEEADALDVAIPILEDACDERIRQVDEAEKMIRYLLANSGGPPDKVNWEWLRPMLNLPVEVLDQVEVRLGVE